MRFVPVKRFLAVVDDADFKLAMDYPWSPFVERRYGESKARAVYKHTKGKAPLHLSHVILPKKKGFFVDHINGDTLDNRRENLRYVTPAQNMMNSAKSRTPSATAPYKGVQKLDPERYAPPIWRSAITVDKKLVVLGRFYTPEEAARTYDEAAKRFFGQFARVNFPDESSKQIALVERPSVMPVFKCGCGARIEHLGRCWYRTERSERRRPLDSFVVADYDDQFGFTT